ncbi:uncharacterized protein LOC128997593 [Macrosteles quadrilineatus]|uniref:uncharacterized protein LOC128997593 n=1 Tax=Macrosteles quadrilineatus TaxID=74068 RepID=UPI0023E219B9|nr:uncharacterized protein LOC128997593 [Macrosteles quadrilineatus]
MFRIESYITSIILSYFDRYIKNFRQQDAQVSLWEGDGSFQNLNLDLEVLEEELNLPFSFVSGHIHELLLHVPWTRLTSEPVQITINTIECVMKLKPVGSYHPHARHSRRSLQAMDDPQSQSSLVSSLVNKIICNVSVTCNNLILKYVEEDIVLSMNIKTLSFGTVNNNWEPAFMELNASQLELRKVISLSDVTVCLDKRNASGRIESYLEPLLYRCFITIRLWQSYLSVSAKRAHSTRLDVLCEQMAFTVSEPQLPMLMRLMSLCLALHRKQFSQTNLHAAPSDDTIGDKEDTEEGDDDGNPEESWSSWAFGWMPTLIPLADDGEEGDLLESNPPTSVFNFGFYVDTFTLALKLCEADTNGGMKTQSQAFMHLLLNGCKMDLLSHNADWTNVQMGICQATVKPDGECCCGVSEALQMVYLSSGSMQEEFLSGSLFDKQPSKLQERLCHSWKYHLESVSEAIMLEKTPAFAVDYLSCNQDKYEDSEEDSDDEDSERLPAKEKVVIRYVAGPVVIRVCSGLIHRLQMLMKACANYDYVPYTTNTTLPAAQDNQVLDLVHRLSEKRVEMDEDLYSRYLPVHTAQFTVFNTIVELYPANHLPVHYSTLGRKLSRTQRRGCSLSPPPCVILECQCVYATLTRPLYPDKILLMVYITSHVYRSCQGHNVDVVVCHHHPVSYWSKLSRTQRRGCSLSPPPCVILECQCVYATLTRPLYPGKILLMVYITSHVYRSCQGHNVDVVVCHHHPVSYWSKLSRTQRRCCSLSPPPCVILECQCVYATLTRPLYPAKILLMIYITSHVYRSCQGHNVEAACHHHPVSYWSKLSRTQRRGCSLSPPPCVILECQCVYATLTRPLYPDKILLMTYITSYVCRSCQGHNVEAVVCHHHPVSYWSKLSRTQRRGCSLSPPPCVILECQCVYATLTRPLYPDKILLMTYITSYVCRSCQGHNVEAVVCHHHPVSYWSKLSRTQRRGCSLSPPPCVILECQCVYATLTRPLYPDKILLMTYITSYVCRSCQGHNVEAVVCHHHPVSYCSKLSRTQRRGCSLSPPPCVILECQCVYATLTRPLYPDKILLMTYITSYVCRSCQGHNVEVVVCHHHPVSYWSKLSRTQRRGCSLSPPPCVILECQCVYATLTRPLYPDKILLMKLSRTQRRGCSLSPPPCVILECQCVYATLTRPLYPDKILLMKLSRTQRRCCSLSPPPCVILECQCVYATLTRPLYPDKILLMASKFHKDRLPPEIMNTSLTKLAFKAVGVGSSLRLPFLQAMKVVEMSSVSSEQSWHSLITPLEDTVSSDVGLHIENVTTTSSKAKLILLCEIVSSLIATNNRQRYIAAQKTIYNTSLLQDAATTTDTIFLKLVVEHVKLRRVVTALCTSTCVSVAACQLFAVKMPDKGDEWETMIVSAPDTDSPVDNPLLDVLYQQPVGVNQFPPILTFNLKEVRLSTDPLLYSWLLYTPSVSFPAHQSTLMSHKSTESLKSRKISESSLSSYMRRAPTPHESAPSSSERETLPSQPLVDTVPLVPLPDKVASLYPQWKTMIVYGDISQVSIYLPNSSLASPCPLTMEEGLQAALCQTNTALQVLVVKLPSVSLRCSNHKQGLEQFTEQLPVRLPPNLWSAEKDNFPWTVAIVDLHCYTMHGATTLPLLKPVSFNCTIGTSPKFSDPNTMISLALCVHLDTTPVSVNISEEQVVLIVSLIMAQWKVVNVLMPSLSVDSPPTESSMKLISSDESSNVTQSDELGRGGGPVKVKLTGWLQWTLVRTTLSMYSKPSPDQLKLALDVEDIILSLDVERVYHKVKLKVATASVYHYTRPPTSERWKRGVFHGLVMRGYDPDDIVTNHSGDSGFLMATVTRAKCNNFHSRLGSPTKHPALSKKTLKSEKFITEIEIKMQPLDFVLSPTTIGVFVQVLDPLLCLLQAPSGGGGHKPSPPLHSSSLPLLYLDLNSIRVVLPMSRDQLSSGQPDVLLIQFHSLTANPHPENPLCRSPLRPDIYHKGEKQRTLNIPGSELEDRQYQFSIYRLCVETGLWSDLKELFVREEAVSSQHQNPALDWNEGRSPMFQVQPDELTAPLVRCFSLNVVVAPAMIYMDKDIVCGHAVEINAVSDITVFVTLDQLELCVVLASEMMSVLCLETQRLSHSHSPPSVTSSTTRLHLTLAEHDSGIDTESSFSHIRQDPNLPAVHAVSPSGYSQASGLVHSPLPSSIYPTPTPLVWPGKRSIVPCEVLITGSSIKVSLMSVVREKQNTYEPLCFTLISQPHTFICRNTDNILTVQMSAFDVGVKCGVAGHTVGHWDFSGWGSKVFLQPLLESRSGEPHPLTGIPPSAVTVKVVWDNDKPPKIDFDMGRPIRIVCTLEIIEYLKRLQTMIYSSIFEPLKKCPNTSEGVGIQVSEIPVGESTDHYLRKLLRKFSKVAVKTQQIVLVVKSSTQEINSCAELCVSVGGCEGHMTSILSLQHAANGVLHLDTVTISTHKVTSPKAGLLLSPWQLIVHTSLCWDSWVSSADPPQVSISADSDILSLHLSPEQLTCLQAIVKDYYPLLSQRGEAGEKQTLSRANSTGDSAGEEQYYHDDLQAGAFQFVDAANERGREEPPLTYQVVFWQSLPPAMAWRYPQPRAITKFCVMPIPFMESDDSAGKVVDPSCTLQYYSDTQASYQDYATFSLSQTSAQTVELAQFPPRVVATTWRVVINRGGAVVPVQALAASVRVDSYFSPALIPAVQVSIGLTAVQLSLWTQTDRCLPLPEPLNRYYLDRRFPEEHDFFTAVLEQANIAYSVWPKVSRQLCVKGRVRVNVLNYHTLSSQCCMSPCPVVASCYTTADCRQYSFVTGHCNVRLGPALSHSLAASLATWHEPRTQVLYTPYVVCNNTCFPLRFRQAGSDEYILLQVFSCHLYSWRTTKHPMKMEFGLMWFGPFENNAWSKSLYLRPGSSSVVKLSTSKQEAAFIVTVKQLTPTVCQVVIDGQLSLYNQLSLPVDVFMVPDGDGQPCSLWLAPGAMSPSVVVIDGQLSLYNQLSLPVDVFMVPDGDGQPCSLWLAPGAMSPSVVVIDGQLSLYNQLSLPVDVFMVPDGDGQPCSLWLAPGAMSPSVVVIDGQLSLYNQLSLPVDVFMVPDGDGQPSSLLVAPGATSPSVVLDPRLNLSLKVRFSKGPAPWSGDIPLRPQAKLSKQWEVKLPMEEKGQFRSVWCNVIFNTIEDIHQILVVFSPLYTIKSLLPCQANVVVDTPALSASQVVPITGKGTIQQLDTPGLSSEKHNITFQLDCKVPASSPPVSLHYNMLDGSPAPPSPETEIASLLPRLQCPAPASAWPYLGEEWAGVEWISTTQPDTVTNVRVKFSEDVVASNTLLVEVQPWALLINTLGSHVYLQGRERTLCSLAHRAVLSPPPLESTFQIGVELENSVQLSDSIQLKRGPGFEMPHIPGLLPLCGFINITVTGQSCVCYMNVTSSEVSNLRLIHVRSSYVIASLSNRDLLVSAIAVKPSSSQYSMTEEMLKQPVSLRAHTKSSKPMCQPLTEWRVIGDEEEVELVPYLVIQVGGGGPVSCPVRLPGGPERHSVPVIFPAATEDSVQEMLVMTVEQVDGQTHLLLWDQPHPQLTLHNHTHCDVIFAKAKTDNGGGFVADCEHIKWQMSVPAGETAHYSFPNNVISPETVLPPSLPPAVIAVVSNETNEVKWSDPVALTQCTGRLLSLLGLPDMTLTVTKRGYTTHITLSQASHTEILAVDIRGQLTRQLLLLGLPDMTLTVTKRGYTTHITLSQASHTEILAVDIREVKWSDPVVLTQCTGRLLSLLGLPDMTLTVTKRGYTTHITLSQASHTEILAVDIREVKWSDPVVLTQCTGRLLSLLGLPDMTLTVTKRGYTTHITLSQASHTEILAVDIREVKWSDPVVLTQCTGRLLSLLGLPDMTLTVTKRGYTTHITLSQASHTEILAVDIREVKWSDPVALTQCTGRLLSLLGLPDMTLTVTKRGYTTHITLSQASHTEILAVDIREVKWSDPVALTQCTGRLLSLLGLPDMTLTVTKRGYTTHITLSQASHTEILAVDIREVKWSDPVVLTQCTGRLLSLLGLPDMTLTVTKRGYTTHITLSQASHTEILAVDIREVKWSDPVVLTQCTGRLLSLLGLPDMTLTVTKRGYTTHITLSQASHTEILAVDIREVKWSDPVVLTQCTGRLLSLLGLPDMTLTVTKRGYTTHITLSQASHTEILAVDIREVKWSDPVVLTQCTGRLLSLLGLPDMTLTVTKRGYTTHITLSQASHTEILAVDIREVKWSDPVVLTQCTGRLLSLLGLPDMTLTVTKRGYTTHITLSQASHTEILAVDIREVKWSDPVVLTQCTGRLLSLLGLPDMTLTVTKRGYTTHITLSQASHTEILAVDIREVKWSDPVALTQCTGRLLSLLGLPDMTLTVTKRGYTTHITLSQASHTEILAVDIRGQLTRQLLSERRLSSPSHSSKKELQDSDSETHETTPPPSIPPSENETGKGQGLEISCYLHGLTTTLLSHSELGCECHEVAALTVDHVGITVHPHPHQDLSVREMKIHTTVGDIQLDNQEFSLGGYDFPVVLLMQKPRKEVTEVSMSQHAHCLVDKARKRGCGADLTVVVDVNSHASIGQSVQDVSVKLAPLQIYIEDKYIYHLKECILNTLPSSFVVETPLNAPKTTYPTSQRRTRPTPTTRNVERNAERPKPKHKLRRDEESIFSKDNLKKDLSEEAEEDLFNVSDPEDNQSLEEISAVEAVSQAKSVYETDSVWTVNATSSTQGEEEDLPSESGFPVPPEVLSASRDLARPLRLRSLSISELDLLVSIHTSTKFYIALDHSPLQLAAFRRSSLFTTAYRLGHSLTLHYFFGAIYGTGWALGSLELLGAPGGLARSLGLGLRDFISLPLQGMLLGPRAFFTGIAHGSASLMHHFAAGTITSVTRLAASWARTLDRLTLDTRDLERSEQLRRLRPQSLSQGVVQGLTEFGISLIGAISSIAHHPLQYVMSERPDHGLVSSVGLGLVGVITRPLSGVAELVALTGEGLLSGVGWTDVPRVRHEPLTQHSQCGSDSRLKYQWKLLPPSEDLLFTSEATSDCYEAVTLLVTTQSLYVVNSELDISTRAVRLGDVQVMYSDDPTLVALRVQPAKEQAQLLSQIRILEYVRESQRMLIGELSHISPSTSPVPEQDEPHFQFFVNPQVRSHFLAVLHFAKSHATNRGFSVIS